MKLAKFAALPLILTLLTSCQTVYYGAMEKIGHPKRQILVDRVEAARDDQEAAKVEFKSALEEFTAVTGFKGGKLQEAYDALSAAYDRSKSKADDVHTSIAKVDDVAQALFREWEAELKEYANESLRRQSAQQLSQTRERYAQLIGAMKRVESRIAPVLTAFHDQVLFLKHNLNAQAIASLQGQLDAMETDVGALIKEMEASIAEANQFIAEMGTEKSVG